MSDNPLVSRRSMLTATATVVAGAASAASADDRVLGNPRTVRGERSKRELSELFFKPGATPATGSARTPLQDLFGTVTPADLHFQRHHSGVPDLDPATHRLLVHGLVEQPLFFSVDDLKRFPAVSRFHFIECAGNSGREHLGQPGETVQISHGLLSNSEWTGVPLRTLLNEVGVRAQARWIVAEGADAARLDRSIPLAKAIDDVLVAYAQNGEPLRPAQGYPLRLVVPGWEGNVNIKWLGRLELTDGPAMTRDEAAYYTDLLADGRARQFTFMMEAKSVITRPSGGQKLGAAGPYEIEGLAWSGHGKITRVEVSVDGGASWQAAQLQAPVLAKAVTRFRLPWRWNGSAAELQSRCTDETGYVQPTRDELVAVRGPNASDHYNGIKSWFVRGDGTVSHA